MFSLLCKIFPRWWGGQSGRGSWSESTYPAQTRQPPGSQNGSLARIFRNCTNVLCFTALIITFPERFSVNLIRDAGEPDTQSRLAQAAGPSHRFLSRLGCVILLLFCLRVVRLTTKLRPWHSQSVNTLSDSSPTHPSSAHLSQEAQYESQEWISCGGLQVWKAVWCNHKWFYLNIVQLGYCQPLELWSTHIYYFHPLKTKSISSDWSSRTADWITQTCICFEWMK